MKRYMTKKEVEAMFKELCPELLKGNDYFAKQLAWAELTDSLCKDGKVNPKRKENWMNPRFICNKK